MVTLENVHRKLGPGVEFRCERFHADEGIQLALWGPSGCGKSTMLNIISGLLRPHGGVVKVDGRQIETLSEGEMDEFRAQRFGFVFQTFNLLAPFSALQNVELGMRFADVLPSREWKHTAATWLERVGLKHRLRSRVTTLSVGEKQRVAIARALANRPRIVVADEPTGSLDPKTAQGVMDLLLELCLEERTTLLLVTHDPSVAERLSARFDCSHLVHEVAETAA